MTHGKVPHDLQQLNGVTTMHKPEHLCRLATAAQLVAEKMDRFLVLPNHIPGYLVVQDSSCTQVLLSLHLGTYGHLCDEYLAENAKIHNNQLLQHPHNSEQLKDGTTSGDVNILRAGSVAASNLIVGYYSRDGAGHPFGNEAVAIVIAVKAGILPRSAIKKRYCNRALGEHNSALRDLFDNLD